ncbi:L,D-transpeptidase [Trichocoleus sp. FACHB-262]|uniref:L,D-transpeptidase n=1 Tax=Trichocoleus sp. FACHB-262 TaxID=2692869 RepID=UPI0028C4CDCA|nr:L,D-transpeptidase [Trichocoleus sp. FACHB-262]
MFPDRSLWVCLGAAICLSAVATPVVAQVAQTNLNRNQAPAPMPELKAKALTPYIPELPPIRPILPDVTTQETRLVLKLKQRRLYVYQGKQLKVSYPVAVGRSGWETPTGQFRVMGMVQNPGWTNPFTRKVMPPGPGNPLGDRWIAFWTDGRNSIGFHGTPDRDSVGQAASHGCVRMLNEDIRELYEIAVLGTPVRVEL